MKYFIFFLAVFFNTTISFAQWENMNSGINDNLTGVVFLQTNGLACGEHGIYYTTNGGVGASSWTRFQITNNATNSLIYENTKFTHCFSNYNAQTNTGYVFACGQNTLTGRAQLFRFSVPSMAYVIAYTGPDNSKLNKIAYSSTNSRYLAVGDNGLILSFSSGGVSTLSSATTDNLASICDNTYNGNLFKIGSSGKVRQTYFNGTSLNNTIEIVTPDASNKGLYDNYSVGNEKFLKLDFSTGTASSNSNFTAPLDANCIYDVFVGTDHGIYRTNTSSSSQTQVLEWQTTSLNYHINGFWDPAYYSTGTSYIYACGNDGVLLRTSNSGGSTKPYVKIISDGGCYPGSVNFSTINGSLTSANWYSNGVLFHSGLGTVNYNFPASGSYNITIDVQNSYGIHSTDAKNVTVVPIPNVSKTFTISDNILCKQESIQIQINDSEPNVIYSLKLEGQPNSNFGQSQISTGGNLVFTTGLIDVTGNYYLYAKNNLANCGNRFLGNFLITVEETKADFHSSLINAEVNEPVDFYQNTVDSQNFEWHFGPNATLSTSSLPDNQSSFTLPGQATTSLHSWSNNGCHDTVTHNVPYVYETPAVQDDCFLLTNNSTDPSWPGYYNPDISEMKPTAIGFFTCGTYDDEIFDSNYGITLDLTGKKGGYLAKHDRNGVLKWVVYTVNNTNINSNDNVIYSSTEDSDGNIYISGKSAGKFYDNAGHVTDLGLTPIGISTRYFLIKLNPKGELIWYMQNYVFGFIKLDIDHENNIVALSDFVTNYVSPQLYFNGSLGQLIGQQTTPMDEEATNEIIKISPQGTVIWDTKVRLESANIRELYKIGFDNTNHIYISMGYDVYARVYRTGTNASQVIYGDGGYGGKIGIIKLDKNGLIQWFTQSGTVNTVGNQNDGNRLYDMIVEDDGTIYFTGNNATGNNWNAALNYTYVFYNTNGSTVQTQQGPYFVAKVNSNGICQWIRGAGHTYYGYGYQVLHSGNEIFVMGMISNNGVHSCSGVFDSTDGTTYQLTIGASDYFVSVYDTSGNLKRIFVNGDNTDDFFFNGATGFFKEGDYFYLAKNLGYFTGFSGFNDFGNVVPALNGRDGTILRFTEACGIMRYDANLSNHSFSSLDKLTIAPNPTNNEFTIKLGASFENAILAIYDISGKMISEETFTNVTEIKSNVKGETGVYFVKLKTQDGEKCFKLIKM